MLLRGAFLVSAGLGSWKAIRNSEEFKAGLYKEGLPDYTWEQIAQHKDKNESVWVAFGDGVYDVTNFVVNHPGGEKILLGAGGSVEPYWNLYRVHHKQMVYQMLESMRVGNLKPTEKKVELDDPYLKDPERSQNLVAFSQKPFNAETQSEILTENFVTPNSEFFVRNHLPVPQVDPQTYKFELSFEEGSLEFSLDYLKNNFEFIEVTTSLQCAGNRRTGFREHGELRGVPWTAGAIGTAVWRGIRLRDVIKSAGIDTSKYKHLHVEALDSDANGPFGTNIPLDKAMSEEGDVILAFEMNGQELPRDHGYPMRLIVPGYVGKRNIKWVKKITLSDKESELVWHARDYRIFSQHDSLTNIDFERALPAYEMPVTSVITEPLDSSGFELEQEEITLKGYAYSGGGRGIARVDVTTNGGEDWETAELHRRPIGTNNNWTWSLWEKKVEIPDKQGFEVCVRAFDTSGNTQPENGKHIWNFRGTFNNAWHCIKLNPRNY